MQICDFLYVCRKVSAYAVKDNPKNAPLSEVAPALSEYFEGIVLVPDLHDEIARCIVNEQEVSDAASPKLADIRRNINAANNRVREQLNAVIRSANYKTMLQDTVITTRSGRFCVPVKAEYRNAFPGMVHDQSGTGATLFIEPMAVVSLNNKIKELAADEKDEIEVILRRLSAFVAEKEALLLANSEILTELDFIFAKGELSVAMGGTAPRFNDSGRVNVKKGRHPLLNKETVVPTDIYIGGDFTTLLITGPNTGGKTVSLKTLGLLTIMGQAGLHIPAADESELSVFSEVFADIGDEQSIEQSLSTFSGHMTNIVRILGEVTHDSLVLLDELGAGTDPAEGAALGVAIIKRLHETGAKTAVTTHYSELKMLALSENGMENAACEFDVETLRPTYRLLIGVPGKSNAFAISRRLGMPDSVIDSAKELLSREDERFEDIVTTLEMSRKEAAIEADRAAQYRREAQSLKADYEKQKEKLQKQREKLLQDAKNEARALIDQTKAEADEIVKKMRKTAEAGVNIKEMEAHRAALREKSGELSEITTSSVTPREVRPLTAPLKIGDRVFVVSLAQPGVVASLPNPSGEVFVTVGVMKVKVAVSDLLADETAYKKDEQVRAHSTVRAQKSQFISKELDLRGFTVEDALEALDKYLDDAYLANMSRVDIIHGKGTGALRAAVQTFLKKRGNVKSFRLGEFGEGDTGVTVVELK
ncbi:endonuclease MutS2 [Clostridia bacterium]|nr:endonuclease MutS2 [Clostridia bacterium]